MFDEPGKQDPGLFFDGENNEIELLYLFANFMFIFFIIQAEWSERS